jgi:hypothetical protein
MSFTRDYHIEVGIAIFLFALMVLWFGLKVALGIGGFGPTNEHTVTVQRLYVDYSGSGDSQSSHYMVGTDNGVYEVDNGILLGLWNADELYSRLHEGKTYEITTKGNRVVNILYQKYPYIVAVKELPANN